jgi:predicted RNA-binding protein with PIN domain
MGSKQYTPPNETVDDFIQKYNATTESFEKEISGGVTGDWTQQKNETDGTILR